MDLRQLAQIVGCPIVERNAKESYVFDGQTIAANYAKFLGFEDEKNYEGEKWGSAPYLDASLLHEVCHYLVALPEQRDLPEYGLALVSDGAFPPYTSDYDGCVDQDEQEAQELAVWMLAVKLGPWLKISSKLEDQYEGFADTWRQYQDAKIRERVEHHSAECITRARRAALVGVRFLRQRIAHRMTGGSE